MKKIIMILVSCCILTACMTPEQRAEQKRLRQAHREEEKRAIFEEKVPEPDIDCSTTEDIGEMPTKVDVSDISIFVDDYDTSMCQFNITNIWGFRPFQRISSREFLGYPCVEMVGCYPTIMYFKLPYPIKQMKSDTVYELPKNVCVSTEKTKPYTYTTFSGLQKTIGSIKIVKKRMYSKAERELEYKRLFEEEKAKKLKKAQEQWNEKYQKQQKKKEECEKGSAEILELWKSSNEIRLYCSKVWSIYARKELAPQIEEYYDKICHQL